MLLLVRGLQCCQVPSPSLLIITTMLLIRVFLSCSAAAAAAAASSSYWLPRRRRANQGREIFIFMMDGGGGRTEGELDDSHDGDRSDDNKNKRKLVVVMGATGTGKSRLAIDLATSTSFQPPTKLEIINADSMQVYRGLDVLTNKVPLHDRKGVPHHLLGTVDPNVEFTSKDFRDLAVPIIDDILARGCLPVIVGGTNYYIQALVSPFLFDEFLDDIDECSLTTPKDEMLSGSQPGLSGNDLTTDYDRLKEIDPIAANRIHPNDHRKVANYLRLHASSGILPSELLQGKSSQKWGCPTNFRYDCCFIWIDVSLPVIDRYVEERVDCMIQGGLLNEAYDIYNPNADYTRGLSQAIGVREFEEFFNNYHRNIKERENHDIHCNAEFSCSVSSRKIDFFSKVNLKFNLDLDDEKQRVMLNEAIDKLKANTRRLVRRQNRRLNRLKSLFGWDLHYFDATEALKGDLEGYWEREVVQPCVSLVKAFLCEKTGYVTGVGPENSIKRSLDSRDLWTQYICKACGDRILRGAHEWEQHKLGRGHRKRVSRLRRISLYCTPVDPQLSID